MAYTVLDKDGSAISAADARDAVRGKGTRVQGAQVPNAVIDIHSAGGRVAGEVADCATRYGLRSVRYAVCRAAGR